MSFSIEQHKILFIRQILHARTSQKERKKLVNSVIRRINTLDVRLSFEIWILARAVTTTSINNEIKQTSVIITISKRETKLYFSSSKLNANREEDPNRKRYPVDKQTVDTISVIPGLVFYELFYCVRI